MSIPVENKVYKDANKQFLDHITLYLKFHMNGDGNFVGDGFFYDPEFTKTVTVKDLDSVCIKDLLIVIDSKDTGVHMESSVVSYADVGGARMVSFFIDPTNGMGFVLMLADN